MPRERPPATAAALAAYYTGELGWALVELPPGRKGPTRGGWQAAPIRTPAQAAATWATRPDWGIGLVHAPSRTCALDVDDLDAARRVLAGYRIDLDRLLSGAVGIVSGRPNRAKALFRLPADLDPLPIRRVEQDGRLVVELRCKGGQDVLPPSIHPDTGKPYRWKGHPADVGELPEALAGLWLGLEAQAPERRADPKAPIGEGGRNATLFRLACAMRRHGAPANAIEAALLTTNAARCDPPLPDHEVRRTAASAARYEPEAQPPAEPPTRWLRAAPAWGRP